MAPFIQVGFSHEHLYAEGSLLNDLVGFRIAKDLQMEIHQDLKSFDQACCSEILQLSRMAENQPPRHIPFDPWGKRIDEIQTSSAWGELQRVSAREGLVAIGYESRWSDNARLYQFIKLMMFHGTSAFFTCPLAMTDGAASVLKKFPGLGGTDYFARLTSRDPDHFITAGQWMTERTGGSDISKSETVASQRSSHYSLTGVKWFTSAISSDIALALAQTPVGEISKLSLFLVPVRTASGALNQIQVLRLKDKLGTRAMPTAELELKDTPAYLVGSLGEGVKNISSVLNISRLYNSACAAGTLLRLHQLAVNYADKRSAFGQRIIDHPLHQKTLLEVQALTQASVLCVCRAAQWLNLEEVGRASKEQASLLRFFTPIVKLWTAKIAMRGVSELVESFGGAGYIEDTGIPQFLRDTQVFSIWEGTTNILSLDSMRALRKSGDGDLILEFLQREMRSLPQSAELRASVKKLESLWSLCHQHLQVLLAEGSSSEWTLRAWAWSMGDLLAGLLCLSWATESRKKRDLILAQIFIRGLELPDFSPPGFDHHELRQTLLS